MKAKFSAFCLSLVLLLQVFTVFAGNVTVSASSNANLSETSTIVNISAASTPIYSDAASSSTQLATAYQNSTYPCLETKQTDAEWFKIRYSESSTGWVCSNYAKKTAVTCHKLYSDTSSLTRLVTPTATKNIYATASTSASVVGKVTTKNVLTVINDGDGSDGYSWFKVRFGSTEGWISRKSVNITNCYNQIADRTFSDENIPVIYLSPSRQTGNPYSYGSTNEYEQMNKVGVTLKKILEQNYICKVYIAQQETPITKNCRPLDAAKANADIYLAIHSNATASSSASEYGTQAYYYAGCAQSKQLASNLVSSLNAVSPFSTKNSGIIDSMQYLSNYGYGEVRSPSAYNMVSLLLEVQYHDNADSAKWIINNTNTIAQAIADGMYKTFNFTKKNSGNTVTTDSSVSEPTTPDAVSTTLTTTMTKKTTTTTAPAAIGTLKVTGRVVNVRNAAGTSGSKVITQVKKGASYSYSASKNIKGTKWYYIHVNSSTSGWICGLYVGISSTTATNTASAQGKVKVSANALNVRQGAGTSYKILTTVKKNSIYTYTSTKKVNGITWYKINVNSYLSGWVCGKYIKKQ